MLKTRDDAQKKKIPFSLTHNERKGLVDQVVDGFRTAISNGYYKPGDILPSRNALAAELGVSVRVPKDAMERLARKGLVNPRRGLGSVVLGTGQSLWRGHVVIVWMLRDETSYFATAMIGEIRRQLMSAGYLFSSVVLTDPKRGKSVDLTPLEFSSCRAADLVITLAVPSDVLEFLSESEAKFICVGRGNCKLPGCLLSVGIGSKDAVRELVARFKEKGVKRVLEVSCPGNLMLTESVVTESGIKVEARELDFARRGFGVLDSFMQASFEFFSDFLNHERTLPDLILCSDDYISFGAITAMALAGVRAPEDIRFVVLANRGFRPVYSRTLTRVEYDYPFYGKRIAQCALRILDGQSAGRNMFFSPKLIFGETFR